MSLMTQFPDGFDAATRKQLERGEVLVTTEPVAGAPAPRIIVVAVIEAPPEEVWKHISNPATHQEFMPRVKRSEELWREGDQNRMRTTIDMPFPLKNLTSTTLGKHTVDPGRRWERTWKMESGDYVSNEGSWVLVPFASGGTLARYAAIVQPKVPIPKMIQGMAQEKALPGMIEALRKRSGARA